MDEKTSTTPTDANNPADATPASQGTDTTQPAPQGDNLDPSKSTDKNPADGDKKPADGEKPKDDSPASQFDDDLSDWITKRGMKVPETDAEKQALQDLRNEQREFHRSRQANQSAKSAQDLNDEIKKLNTTDGDDDDDDDEEDQRLSKLEKELQEERVTRRQTEFYSSNEVSPDQHKKMLDIIKEKVSVQVTPAGKARALDYWGSPEALPDLLDLAKARIATGQDTTHIQDEAAQKERERIAKESQASSPGRSAQTPPATGNKTAEEQRTESLLARYKSPKK